MTPEPTGPPTLPPGLESRSTESGVEYFELATGKKPVAREGNRVKVRYRCWSIQGELLEDTAARKSAVEIALGQGDVIQGLEDGLNGMGPGGRRRLIVPSDLAYGPSGHGRVPPYATLIYDVEVLAIS